jgi:hypothetical protein
VVNAEVEYEDKTGERIVVRPGVWYGTRQRQRRVWLTCAGGGVLVFDVAYERGDVVGSVPLVRGVTLWDSGDVAAGAEITSPVLDLRPYASVRIVTKNLDALARPMQYREYADDLVTSLMAAGFVQLDAGGGNSYRGHAFGVGVAAVAPSLFSGVPLAAAFRLAAAGASVGRLWVVAR